MSQSFYFYDLETSGINPREARIMQFAGQRTDMNLQPVGEPHNILIKLTDDVVPEPDAIFITGITPQSTLSDGITEAEFLKLFHEEIATPGTIFVGFNTVRFDDEFMRYLHYRNFYDPYEWQYQDGKSRWDLLDVVRMTRALRPDGIKWPVDENGRPTCRLELITKLNGLDHQHAHDALNDVLATIAVATLIKEKQPKLFEYLLSIRDKKKVAPVVQSNQPFIYTSGKYESEFEKTTVVALLAEHPTRGGALVYDLRHDPETFSKMSTTELVDAWRWQKDYSGPRLPVKTMQFNRCPAVAPLSVLDEASAKRLQIDMAIIKQNYQKLQGSGLAEKVLTAQGMLDQTQSAIHAQSDQEVDARLYDGFFDNQDRTKMSMVRAAGKDELAGLEVTFRDQRLHALLPLYKARNFPHILTDEERATWERYRERKLMGGKQSSRLARYFNRLAELAAQPNLTTQQQYLLEELQLFGQSIMPVELDQ